MTSKLAELSTDGYVVSEDESQSKSEKDISVQACVCWVIGEGREGSEKKSKGVRMKDSKFIRQ